MNVIATKDRRYRVAVAVTLLALVVRGLFVAFYPATPMAGGDPAAYWSFAQSIAAGQGFRSSIEPYLADRPPLYPFFLAGLMRLLGQSREMVFWVQAILGALAGGGYYLLAVELLGEGRGLIAGLLFALLPHFMLFTKQVLTESLYIFLLVSLLGALTLPHVPRRFDYRRWIVVGLLAGLIILVRREGLLPSAVLTVSFAAIYFSGQKVDAFKAVALAALMAAFVVSPWVVRNWRVLGKPMLTSTSGLNFLVGNNPDADGGYTPLPAEWVPMFAGLGEVAHDQKAWEMSLNWIKTHFSDFVGLLPGKLAYLWGAAHNAVLDGVDLVLIPFYGVGLWRLWQRQGRWQCLLAVVVALVLGVTLIGVMFVGGWRYRQAAYPALLLFAAYGAPLEWVLRFKWVTEWLRKLDTTDKSQIHA
jgi:4-amino-4-deoxy-L-arabinose transferase-like glycosyltransferase